MSATATLGDGSVGLRNNIGVAKTPAEGDEEIAGMSLAVPLGPESSPMEPEIIDPAILAVSVEGRTTRQYQYSREKLLELREAPLSRRRPDYLDPIHNKNLPSCWRSSQGLWDPERWHHDCKRSETPNDGSCQIPPDNHKRRSGDPRERLRKEQDGIVLSPQRRSFNSGCFVPVTQQPARSGRPDSPLGKPELGHREITQNARRIGSGRILARDVSWDYRPDKPELDGPQDFTFGRTGTRERKDTDRDERYERRSFGRDYEREKDRHISRNGRFNDRRRISDSKDEEPEWFSGGPTSQSDTIELRGFEDPAGGDTDRSTSSKSGRKSKQSPAKKKRTRERAIARANSSTSSTKEDSPKGPGARSTPTPQEGAEQCGPAPHSPIKEEHPGSEMDDKSDAPTDMSTTSNEPTSNHHPPMDFNIEDFLKMDSIPELLTNGVGSEVGSTAGSRFSRWFNKETSPVQDQDSRRSSLQGDHLVNNIINVIPNIGESDTYFAPISPAASTGGVAPGNQGSGPAPGAKPVTLLEMLQRGKQPIKQPTAGDVPPVMKNIDVPGKVLSLEELEARIRKGSDVPITRNKQDEDMSAFKRLLAQVSGGQAVAASNGPIGVNKQQPMSLLQMLSKSQQEDATRAAVGLLGPQSPGTAAGPHVPNDLVLKLHQVQQHQRQQEMLSKLMNSANSGAAPHRQQFTGLQAHPQDLQGLGASRELLQRPEAVAILQGLKRGDITQQHLMQQLAANPAMQPRHRELLMTILKQSSVGPSPRLSPQPIPQPQHMLFQQQQQQLRVSPLPPNAMQQRIPSPRELQAHTQGIMQRALIKKKLEEQQENFRRKQELQQQQQQQQRSRSPSTNNTASTVNNTGTGSPAKHMSSPTPLAFTPTSVLRKMTAEKEGETLNSKDNNNKATATNENQNKQPPGRPVMGMRPPPVQQAQPLQPPSWLNQPKQPVGRPIVKGANSNIQFPNMSAQEFQMLNQQQRNMYQQVQQHRAAKLGVQAQQQQYNVQNRMVVQGPMRGMQQRGSNSWHHILGMGQSFDNRGMGVQGRGAMLGRGGSPGDGDLSPTSDQLARWFSPELLAQARAGKLPDMPPAGIAQNALSLEELERIQQNTAPVHN